MILKNKSKRTSKQAIKILKITKKDIKNIKEKITNEMASNQYNFYIPYVSSNIMSYSILNQSQNFFREISFGSSRDGGGRVPGEQEIIELGRKIDKTYVFDINFQIFDPG